MDKDKKLNRMIIGGIAITAILFIYFFTVYVLN